MFVCPPAAPAAEVHVHMSKAGSSFGGQQLASVWNLSRRGSKEVLERVGAGEAERRRFLVRVGSGWQQGNVDLV